VITDPFFGILFMAPQRGHRFVVLDAGTIPAPKLL
jgi:hypothetical protein